MAFVRIRPVRITAQDANLATTVTDLHASQIRIAALTMAPPLVTRTPNVLRPMRHIYVYALTTGAAMVPRVHLQNPLLPRRDHLPPSLPTGLRSDLRPRPRRRNSLLPRLLMKHAYTQLALTSLVRTLLSSTRPHQLQARAARFRVKNSTVCVLTLFISMGSVT